MELSKTLLNYKHILLSGYYIIELFLDLITISLIVEILCERERELRVAAPCVIF